MITFQVVVFLRIRLVDLVKRGVFIPVGVVLVWLMINCCLEGR